jgi:hypothetical protein
MRAVQRADPVDQAQARTPLRHELSRPRVQRAQDGPRFDQARTEGQ